MLFRSCSYLEEFGDRFQTIGDLFGYIALERILLNQNAGILHASFVKVNGEGIYLLVHLEAENLRRPKCGESISKQIL